MKITEKALQAAGKWKFAHDKRANKFFMLFGFTKPDPDSPLVGAAGLMVDVTDSVDATVLGMSNYMRRVENMLIHTWIELARAKGETCSDEHILNRLRQLDADVNGGPNPPPEKPRVPLQPMLRPSASLFAVTKPPPVTFKAVMAPKVGL